MKACVTAILLILVTIDVGLAAENDPVVVIVHRSNPISDITSDELRRIYSGALQRWEDGQKFLVLEHPGDHEIREFFHRTILMANAEKQYFLADSPVRFKSTVRVSSRSIMIYSKRFKNAIGYVRLSEVSEDVKTLTINGVGPHDEAYILK